MLAQIVSLLLGTAAGLLTTAFLARTLLQLTRAPFRNPVGQFITALTNWAVLPLRRVIPGLFGIDLASVFAAWLTQIVYFAVMAGLTGMLAAGPDIIPGLLWLSFLAVLRMAVYLLMGVVIIAALLSWINPYSPFAPLFDALARPLLNPVRRLLPTLGGVDLSPLVVLLLLQVALVVLASLQPALMFSP
ncbi:MAG: YggT family protein [Gammaproteobacteria bacterium]|nr:YggT family protein [Rhodocyclaceae bacterium]MBU3909172.1 YggT family protein [Gammaproteobacteria bacterium]MBU3990016.1 YggT family protein [Gammaproteobacteria bacterium]MBU4005668.1 YggT family protein [Gammaproteobacteria bacterium]MBU4020779.1 YggT family protein [Gammaproteobacteria bacterium]